MERIKDWKSYQNSVNRKKRRRWSIFSSVKFIGIIFAILVITYGSIRLFYAGRSYFLKKNAGAQGTGIRPIGFSENKNTDPDSSYSKNNGNDAILLTFSVSGGKLSLKSLKDYFSHNPPKFNTIENGHYIQKIGGYTIVYTLNPVVQKEAERVFKKYTVPFGAVAAVNPETGAVLALASYSHNKDEANEISPLLAYPPGSLAKIITASAAIESKGFYPGLNICFNGGLYGTDKAYWKQNINTGTNRLSFSLAFAKSCDVAFGKIAGFYVGRRVLGDYFNKFYFNKKIPFILNLSESRAKIPGRFYQLELAGAGFQDVYATPLHEALIAAAVINKGKLIKPYIIEEIIAKDGKVVYTHKGITEIDNPIEVKTAAILRQMMIETITKGVGHPDFYNIYGRYVLPSVITGGKTGTISGQNPDGLYQWFAGFGESGDKKIALSALVVEKPVWRIGGGGVAEKVMFAYFFKNNSVKTTSLSKNLKKG